MEKVNELIKKIAETTLKSIPVDFDWEFAVYSSSILITYSESSSKIVKGDIEKSLSVKFRDENGKAMHPNPVWQLREAMYNDAPKKGAWFSMEMRISKERKFDIRFDYENKPVFSIPLEDLDFIKDYQKFPRDKELIQDWLLEILVKNNIDLI